MLLFVGVGIILLVTLTNKEVKKAEVEEDEFCREYER